MQSMSEPSAITGLPDPQSRRPRGRNAGDAALNREAFLLEDAGQVALRLELLEAELAEAEHRIDHLLRKSRTLPVDLGRQLLLVLSQLWIRRCRGDRGCRRRRLRGERQSGTERKAPYRGAGQSVNLHRPPPGSSADVTPPCRFLVSGLSTFVSRPHTGRPQGRPLRLQHQST